MGDAWDEAFAAARPVVLDIHTDANVPPLPPHISFKHTKNMFSTLAKGDPAGSAVIKDSAKGMLAENWQKAKNALNIDGDDD